MKMNTWTQMVSTICLSAAIAFAASATERKPGSDEFFSACGGCHSFECNRSGAPKLGGVIGRKAGTVAGFQYSRHMKKSDVTWTLETLDAFLAEPEAVVPGTHGGGWYAGTEGAEADRRKILQFIQDPDDSSERCW